MSSRIPCAYPWIVCAVCIACAQQGPSPGAVASNTTASDSSQVSFGEPSPYPRGRWRLASPDVLANSMIWASHILIRYDGAAAQVPATGFPWSLAPAAEHHSRLEALEIATEVQAKAASAPERFEELAKQHSEDPTTRDVGGYLGGVRVWDLQDQAPVLDALAALKHGEISRVVETASGFEILERHAPPEERGWVSGKRIVIAMREAPWLGLLTAGVPERSRADAWDAARSIYDEARRDRSAFGSLVRRYSEHPEKSDGGAIGPWSTHEPTAYSRVVRALGALAIGEVSAPIETHLGIEIVQRTESRPSLAYAMEAIELGFVATDAAAKAAALLSAREMLNTIRKDPQRFDQLRKERCCATPRQWLEGDDEHKLSDVVAALEFGEISAEPVEQFASIVIPRRVRPESRVAMLDVPSPERVDFGNLVNIMPPALIVREVRAATELHPECFSTPEQMQALADLLGRAADEWLSADLLKALSGVFEPDSSGQLRLVFDQRIARLVLNAQRS